MLTDKAARGMQWQNEVALVRAQMLVHDLASALMHLCAQCPLDSFRHIKEAMFFFCFVITMSVEVLPRGDKSAQSECVKRSMMSCM